MIRLKTSVPGPKSFKVLEGLKKKNGGWGVAYPLVFSGGGHGPYCGDIDGNVFLDFASQIATNPMGYNHPEMVDVVKSFSDRFPLKYAGQDFTVREHLELIERLTGISPKGMDSAFLINSGAEAVENAIKICMRKRPKSKIGISMRRAFHGRTLGALSLTNSNKVQKTGYMRLPMMRLDFDESAGGQLERILEREAAPDEIGFVILEHVQGEGGYYPAPKKMVDELRAIAKKNGIPYIADEVQAGMGRTGRWWAFENYGIAPDVFASAKALQVGAVVSRKDMFPGEPGAISSTWGGGHVLDLALSMKTIEIIKKEKMLSKNVRLGNYMLKRLSEMGMLSGQRGLGLMMAFDMPSRMARDHLVIECAKQGLLLLGCGTNSVRVIPPYVTSEEDADIGLQIIERATKKVMGKGFSHKGKIFNFMGCSHSHS
jgi:4-aminobutyrate aminotransferase